MNGETRSELTRSRSSLALDYQRAMQANAELRRELQKCRRAKSQALSRLKKARYHAYCRGVAMELWKQAAQAWEQLARDRQTPAAWFKGLLRRAQA